MKNDALLKNMKNTFYSYYIFVDQIFSILIFLLKIKIFFFISLNIIKYYSNNRDIILIISFYLKFMIYI